MSERVNDNIKSIPVTDLLVTFNSLPSPFPILQFTYSFCFSHTLPTVIPTQSLYGDASLCLKLLLLLHSWLPHSLFCLYTQFIFSLMAIPSKIAIEKIFLMLQFFHLCSEDTLHLMYLDILAYTLA